MKIPLGICLGFALAIPLAAQAPAFAGAPALASSLRSAEQLDQLLAPVALYPDALIALILPASTASADLVLASRYLAAGGDPAAVDSRAWDDSVKSLTHYPSLVKWMDENLEWTQQLGEAFLAQPADVMKSIQRLRAQAHTAGTLVDTPQQISYLQGETIYIVPAQADVIYVPYYDPDLVYYRRSGYYSSPYFSFGTGFPVGAWLSFNLDWGHHRVWLVERRERERYWREHHDWRRPIAPGGPGFAHDLNHRIWTPPPNYSRPLPRDSHWQQPAIIRPAPPPGSPPPYARRDPLDRRPGDRPRDFPANRQPENSGARVASPGRVVPPATLQTQPAARPTGPQPVTPPIARRDQPERRPDDRPRDATPNRRPDNPGAPVANTTRIVPPPTVQNSPVAQSVGPQPATPPPASPPVRAEREGRERRPRDQQNAATVTAPAASSPSQSMGPQPQNRSYQAPPLPSSPPPSRQATPSSPPPAAAPAAQPAQPPAKEDKSEKGRERNQPN
ncbi:MAG: DUF3300 domain-containing protein [Opitutus sp.]|nr:DUF3300 domain-containing protein [Opitutus sp.]